MSIVSLIATYGYLVVFLGGVLEGEMVLIFGGLAAHAHYLNLYYVMFFALAGALISDFTFFFLGRYKGVQILSRWPRLHRLVDKRQDLIHRHALWVSFVSRFLYGFRNVVPFVLGMSKMKTRVYLTLNIAGAIVWVVVVGMGGYFFGEVLKAMIGRLRYYELRVVFWTILIGVAVHILYTIIRWLLNKFL